MPTVKLVLSSMSRFAIASPAASSAELLILKPELNLCSVVCKAVLVLPNAACELREAKFVFTEKLIVVILREFSSVRRHPADGDVGVPSWFDWPLYASQTTY